MTERDDAGRARRPFYVSDRWMRVRAEVERNRAGGHRVPTWALALALVVMIGAIALGMLLG